MSKDHRKRKTAPEARDSKRPKKDAGRALAEKIALAKQRAAAAAAAASKGSEKTAANESTFDSNNADSSASANASASVSASTKASASTGSSSAAAASGGSVSASEPEFVSLGNTKLHPLLQDIVHKSDEGVQKAPVVAAPGQNPYFDPLTIKPQYSARKNKGLVFNEKGKYVALADDIRRRKQEEEKALQIHEERLAKGLEPDFVLKEELYKKQLPPLVEWWDEEIFEAGTNYETLKDPVLDSECLLVNKDSEENPVTHYVQHPRLLPAPWELHQPVTRPMYLTKKELKRVRKNRRAEANKEKRDKIRLGLEPAPAPKIKLANLMNVLTNEAIRDPTAVEMRVRQEMEERRLNHLKMNEERSLNKEDKNEKLERKNMQKIEQLGVHCAVFRVDSLTSSQHIYKLDINAKQYKLSGMFLLAQDLPFSLVIVQGSETAVAKYKHLALQRIKWDASSGEKCSLIWEGQLASFDFTKWTMHKVREAAYAMDLLRHYGADTYWTMAAATEAANTV